MNAIKVFPGVSIYQVAGSKNWYVRIWDRERHRYLVKGTGESSAIVARDIAKHYALTLLKADHQTPTEFTFRHFATKCLTKSSALTSKGERNANYARVLKWVIQNNDWGLVRKFGSRDIRELKTHDFQNYIDGISKRFPTFSSSTKNTIRAAFRNVMKAARDDGVIDRVPDTPRSRQHDNPRPFLRFYPLVDKKDDLYKRLLETANAIAQEKIVIRGVPLTDELYDLILFVTHSFVRPIVTELYAIRHNDITVATNPKRLIVIVRNGKTGFRAANTMPGAVAVYERIRQRHPHAEGEDYIFLPKYKNRQTASRILQRQFNQLLTRAGVERDIPTGKKHTIYSLRHTAICMRIILSQGKVNIFNLAKNAGTSVDQIERFYARNLPLSRDMAINLQSFGSG